MFYIFADIDQGGQLSVCLQLVKIAFFNSTNWSFPFTETPFNRGSFSNYQKFLWILIVASFATKLLLVKLIIPLEKYNLSLFGSPKLVIKRIFHL